MQPYDLAIPTLPSRSIAATAAFYQRLGFEGGVHEFNNAYSILRRGAAEPHFLTHEKLVPTESSAGCYIRVLGVETFFRDCLTNKLPPKSIPRMEALQGKP